MIAGIGVDTVDIARFEGQLERASRLRERLFTPVERELPLASLAARFAAKEALIKALGGSEGLTWQGMEVPLTGGAPQFSKTDELATLLRQRDLAWPRVSLTHDGGVATAFVVIEYAEGDAQC